MDEITTNVVEEVAEESTDLEVTDLVSTDEDCSSDELYVDNDTEGNSLVGTVLAVGGMAAVGAVVAYVAKNRKTIITSMAKKKKERQEKKMDKAAAKAAKAQETIDKYCETEAFESTTCEETET